MRMFICFIVAVLTLWLLYGVFHEDEQPNAVPHSVVVKVTRQARPTPKVAPVPTEVVASSQQVVPPNAVTKDVQENPCTNFVSDGVKNICLPEVFAETPQQEQEEYTQDEPFFDPPLVDLDADASKKVVGVRNDATFINPVPLEEDVQEE